MTIAQRWLIIWALCAIAVGLHFYFIEYGSRPVMHIVGGDDLRPVGLIMPLAKPQGVRVKPDFPRCRLGEACDTNLTQPGIYAAEIVDASATEHAMAGGLLVPFMLIAAAAYMALGRLKK